MVRVIRLKRQRPAGWAASLKGKFIGAGFYRPDLLFGGEVVDVYKPNGDLLLALRPRAVLDQCHGAYLAMMKAAVWTDNRGTAAGGGWHQVVKADGTLSNRRRARRVLSGIMGYSDAQGQEVGCRQTAFTSRNVNLWRQARPLIRATDGVFREACPDRYAAHLAAVQNTHPYFVINGTAYTTITVNRNWQTAVHTDEGDLPEGFGVMAVVRARGYEGGYLVFPRYEVAVDMREGDVCLADVHEYHGNTPIIGSEGWERISCVFYYRSGMRDCGTPAQELRRARGLTAH